MSACWYAEVDGELACTVHCVFYPCSRVGEAAAVWPVHIIAEPGDEEVAVEQWHLACAARRPLLRHVGLVDGGSRHVIDDVGSCWCAPTRFEPDDSSSYPGSAGGVMSNQGPIVHAHGQHTWHEHTAQEYAEHQQPIDDEQLADVEETTVGRATLVTVDVPVDEDQQQGARA